MSAGPHEALCSLFAHNPSIRFPRPTVLAAAPAVAASVILLLLGASGFPAVLPSRPVTVNLSLSDMQEQSPSALIAALQAGDISSEDFGMAAARLVMELETGDENSQDYQNCRKFLQTPSLPKHLEDWKLGVQTSLTRHLWQHLMSLETVAASAPALGGDYSKERRRTANIKPEIDENLKNQMREAATKLIRLVPIFGSKSFLQIVNAEPRFFVSFYRGIETGEETPEFLPAIPLPVVNLAFNKLIRLDPKSEGFDNALKAIESTVEVLEGKRQPADVARMKLLLDSLKALSPVDPEFDDSVDFTAANLGQSMPWTQAEMNAALRPMVSRDDVVRILLLVPETSSSQPFVKRMLILQPIRLNPPSKNPPPAARPRARRSA
jgi:hypothetical protein